DAVLIVGSHVRWEAPLVNVRLRKAAKRGAKVFVVGPYWDPTYPAEFLGEDAAVLHDLPDHVAEAMQGAQRPAVILGGAGLVAGGARARAGGERVAGGPVRAGGAGGGGAGRERRGAGRGRGGRGGGGGGGGVRGGRPGCGRGRRPGRCRGGRGGPRVGY